MKNEIFAKPAVGAIVEKDINGKKYILMQKRQKHNAEDGMLEIPAGKIREFESIFDALKREVREETGFHITKIFGADCNIIDTNDYTTMDFSPFCITQNLSGGYSLILFTFICCGDGELYEFSDESSDVKWISVEDVCSLLASQPQKFFPMHVNALKKYFKMFGYNINE